MRKLIGLIFLCSLAGCSLNPDTRMNSVVPIFDRAVSKNVTLNSTDTGVPKAAGVIESDVDVASLDRDYDVMGRAILAYYNGATEAEALTIASLGTAATIVGLSRGPVGAAAGLGLAVVAAKLGFGIVNTPAKANAYLDFLGDLSTARKAYKVSRAAACAGPTIPGDRLTPDGAVWSGLLDDARSNLTKQLQNSRPTLESMDNLASAASMTRQKLASMPDCTIVNPPVGGGGGDTPPPLPGRGRTSRSFSEPIPEATIP